MAFYLIDTREIPNARLLERKDTQGECNVVAADFQWVEINDPVTEHSHYWDGAQAVAFPPKVTPTPLTIREKIQRRLQDDPFALAQAREMRDRLGLTNAQMIDLLEQKASGN